MEWENGWKGEVNVGYKLYENWEIFEFTDCRGIENSLFSITSPKGKKIDLDRSAEKIY